VRASARSALGSALLAAGRPRDAVAPLEEAVRLYAEKQLTMSPDRSDAMAALARAQAASSGALNSPDATR
jgi:hypothetical protein